LLAEVEHAAEAAGGWESVDGIAVGIGPGSFTGLRIGIATAQSLRQALGIGVAPVGTLEALARGAAADGRPVLALLDARRGEVFAMLRGGDGELVWEPFAAPPAEVVSRAAGLSDPLLAVGSGALRFRDELEKGGIDVASAQDRHRIDGLQVCAVADGVQAGGEPIAPVYLRPPDAQRWHERDSTES
jgi:tRNA threonylcarbamoyladenosine biosynthesis protein TsaB